MGKKGKLSENDFETLKKEVYDNILKDKPEESALLSKQEKFNKQFLEDWNEKSKQNKASSIAELSEEEFNVYIERLRKELANAKDGEVITKEDLINETIERYKDLMNKKKERRR